MVGCCVLTRIANSSEKNIIEIITWSPNEYKHINADVNNEISLFTTSLGGSEGFLFPAK
jgi:hypothetical protein